MFKRVALLCALPLLLSCSSAFAQEECNPVRDHDGHLHFPGEIWRDVYGVHALPGCILPRSAKIDSVRNADLLCRIWARSLNDQCGISERERAISLIMTLPRPIFVHDDKADPKNKKPKLGEWHPFTMNEFCNDVKVLQYNMGIVFDGTWRMNIYSPYSGDVAIGSCALPASPNYGTEISLR